MIILAFRFRNKLQGSFKDRGASLSLAVAEPVQTQGNAYKVFDKEISA